MCGRSGTAAGVRGSRGEADVGGREIHSGKRAHGFGEGPGEVPAAGCRHCRFFSFPSRALGICFRRIIYPSAWNSNWVTLLH